MDWQRMIQRLIRRKRRSFIVTKNSAQRRKLRHEALDKRELLASDLGAISGVSFADLTQNGLDASDPRLSGVTIELYRDVDASGTLTAGDGAAIDTTTSDSNGLYFFRGLDIDTFIVRQLSAGADLIAPDPIAVTISDDTGEVLTTVDDFTQTGQSLTADGTNPTVSSSMAAPEAIGGFRDMLVTRTSATGILNVAADANDDTLSIGSQTSAEGTILVQYDGNDSSITLDPDGLGGISLGGGLPGEAIDADAGILIEASEQNPGDTITIRIFTDAANFAVAANIPIPDDTGVPGEQEDIFVRYLSDFVITGNPDFNDIGAIEFEITASANNDSTFAAFTVRGPNVSMQNLPNEQLLTLGGTVFEDLGGSTDSNDGMLDVGETGLAGITVDLYAEPNGGGAIDPSSQTAVATTTTDVNGNYVFSQLAAGNYRVVIPASEFATGQPLFGYLTSSGNDPAADPDDDADGDDNGSLLAGVGLATAEITLVAGAEPITDGDTDANTNLTLDFGVIPTIDLEITKTLDTTASSLTGGGEAFFDIAFTNNGPLSATNVTITDVLPSGLTIDQADSNFGSFTPTINGQNISVAIGTLAAGASGSIRIAADISTGQTADLTNVATISGDEIETDSTNNDDDAVVSVVNTDLVITKSDNTTGSVIAGQQFTYTITVVNNGPDTATGIVATDNLPSDLTFVSAAFTTGSGTVTESPVGSGDLTISIDDLASTATAVINVVVQVSPDAGTSLSNTATVVGTPDNDTNPNNNSATETTPVVRNVDVGVTKTTTGTATAGGQLTYTVTVVNNGPGTARDVEVADTLDSRLTFDSLNAGTSGVTVTQNGQVLTFDVGSLDSGQSETFTFVVDIASSATGTLNNLATISTTDVDTVATNNTDDVDVAIVVNTDLLIDKSVDLATAVPGQSTLTYTFTISHDTDSVSDSGQVTFTDTLPAGLTGLTINAPDATSSGFDTGNQTVTVVHGPIPVGTTRTFTVTATVNDDATGTITNTGSITVAGGESDTTNNSDTAVTTLTPQFDVTLTKAADDTTPAPGSNVTYTINLTNSGPSTATGVVLTDTVPTGLTFVSGTLDGQAATLNGSTVTFPAITLDDDETLAATLVFTVGVDTSGTVTNTASVTTAAGETNTTNNSATAQLTATPVADLTVVKSVDDAATQPGETLVYTVTVTNNGVSTAAAATAVDTLPTGVTFVSGLGPNNQALSAVGQVVTVNGGSLAPGASFTFTVNATVNAGTSGTLVNNVTVSTTTSESNSTNNSASASTVVDPFLSSIAGAVYVDVNNNGIRESTEVGISGVTITLTGTDSTGGTINRTATTDSNGDYVFSQLAAGTYRVDQAQPEDFRDGQETVGTGATATAIDDAFTNLALNASTAADDFNFGELSAILSKRRFLASS